MRKLFQKLFEIFMNFYPPYFGAGIYLKKISKDHRYARVEMPLRFYNRNYVGTQFGGSLYSMCDPWFMLMIMKNLGYGYIVWDKAAAIRFKKPGRMRVYAEFRITDEDIADIKKNLADQPKYEKMFHVNVVDTEGTLIAEVDKLIYIRKK